MRWEFQSNIEVIVPYVGGGFGGKAGIHLEALVSLISKYANGRPVKLVATREEECSTLPCRQGLVAKVKTGVKMMAKLLLKKSNFSGMQVHMLIMALTSQSAGYSAAGPYQIDNVKVDSCTVYTNHLFGTAYRGFGHAELFWAIERQREFTAKKLNMDSYEFRMKNILKPGSITFTGELITENTGNVAKCLTIVTDKIGWNMPKIRGRKRTREENRSI